MKIAPQFLSAILTALVIGAVCAARAADAPAATRRPNILWITAENMGPDLGCYPDSPWSKQVRTPHLDRLAREGLRFRLAFDTSPVCSSSRSAFMTGMYQTSIGAHNHRSHRHDHYQLPIGVRPLPQRLAEAGYFTANVASMGGKPVGTGKTDLNFEVNGPVLNTALAKTLKPPATDDGIEGRSQNTQNSARLYHSGEWTDLKPRQPFFAQVNLPTVENSVKDWVAAPGNPWNGQTHPAITDPAQITVPPYYPDHPVTRKHWAGYLDSVGGMDTRVGEILARLEADGLADDTVVIFFADNGRLEQRGLDWCYDSGDRVPLIVRWPKNFPAPSQYKAGTVSEQLVSLLDLTATTLAIAEVPKPAGMQSRVFLGAQADPKRSVVFSARDRTDDAVNRIRAVRGPRYRYIRNFMPEQSFLALHRYKEARFPVVPLLRQLHAEGKLTPAQAVLVAPRLPDEELYDLETDPFEIHNLAASANPEHQLMRKEMSAVLAHWIDETNDEGRTPEPADIVRQWTESADRQHGTPAWAKKAAPQKLP
ncbi:MAG: sulfatase [Opitutaceae bacterium]|nr:sulfatase [Opitutaceae bacterium]